MPATATALMEVGIMAPLNPPAVGSSGWGTALNAYLAERATLTPNAVTITPATPIDLPVPAVIGPIDAVRLPFPSVIVPPSGRVLVEFQMYLRAPTTSTTFLWLKENVDDYLGYQGVPLAVLPALTPWRYRAVIEGRTPGRATDFELRALSTVANAMFLQLVPLFPSTISVTPLGN